MKFIGLNGSARKNGKTAELLSLVMESIKKLGAEVEVYHLIEHPIRFCMGCYSEDPPSCNPQHCTQGNLADAMKGFHQKLLFADGVVFATPVYWFGMSALMKAFIERLTSLENTGKMLTGRVAGFVAAGEEDGAMMAISHLMAVTSDMGFIFPPMPFTYYIGRGSIHDDPESVEYARRLGRNLVKLAHILQKEDVEWM